MCVPRGNAEELVHHTPLCYKHRAKDSASKIKSGRGRSFRHDYASGSEYACRRFGVARCQIDLAIWRVRELGAHTLRPRQVRCAEFLDDFGVRSRKINRFTGVAFEMIQFVRLVFVTQ